MISRSVRIADKMMKTESPFEVVGINNFIRREVHDDGLKFAKGNGKVSTAKVEGICSSFDQLVLQASD
jgi:hypothetical protein